MEKIIESKLAKMKSNQLSSPNLKKPAVLNSIINNQDNKKKQSAANLPITIIKAPPLSLETGTSPTDSPPFNFLPQQPSPMLQKAIDFSSDQFDMDDPDNVTSKKYQRKQSDFTSKQGGEKPKDTIQFPPSGRCLGG